MKLLRAIDMALEICRARGCFGLYFGWANNVFPHYPYKAFAQTAPWLQKLMLEDRGFAERILEDCAGLLVDLTEEQVKAFDESTVDPDDSERVLYLTPYGLPPTCTAEGKPSVFTEEEVANARKQGAIIMSDEDVAVWVHVLSPKARELPPPVDGGDPTLQDGVVMNPEVRFVAVHVHTKEEMEAGLKNDPGVFPIVETGKE